MASAKQIAAARRNIKKAQAKQFGKRRNAVSRKSGGTRRHRRSGMRIPLAVVAGLFPTAIHAVQGFQATGVQGALANVSYDLTGYNPLTNQWSFAGLMRGWLPLGLGFIVHKVANQVGVNRMLSGVPFIRI